MSRVIISPNMHRFYKSFPPNFYKFMEDTLSSIPNAYFCITSIEEYDKSHGTNRLDTHYGFAVVDPITEEIKSQLPHKDIDYSILIAVPTPPNHYDIAHELAHFFIHGVAAQFPCRETSGFFLPKGAVV